jgi:DNA-binding IclR family transcriptional regulator
MSSLTTAINILNCFSAETPELRVSDIARRLSIPKSTVSRLLKEMSRSGLAEQDAKSRHYRPGPMAFRLGTLYQAHLQILDLVEAAVEQLVEEFGLTGYIGILDGTDVVILRICQGSYPVRFILAPGVRVPAFATAIGKAMLARFDHDTLIELLPPILRYEVTDFTLAREDLLRELADIRKIGWAESVQKTFLGFGAVGAAVGTSDSRQALGFCLSYPTNAYFETQRAQMERRIGECAQIIAQRCGDQIWPQRDIRIDAAGGPVGIAPRQAPHTRKTAPSGGQSR